MDERTELGSLLDARIADATVVEVVLALATASAFFTLLSQLGDRLFSFMDARYPTYSNAFLLAAVAAFVVCGGLLVLATRRRLRIDRDAEVDAAPDGAR